MKRATSKRPPGDRSTAEHVGLVTESHGRKVCAACVRSWKIKGTGYLPRCAPRLVRDGWPG